LGICVEVDDQWEKLARGEVASQPAPQGLGQHLEVWINLLPTWAWQLIGYNVLVVLASVAVRFTVTGSARMTWSLTQLSVGLIAFCVGHLMAYLKSISEDAQMNALDIIMRPYKTWKPVFRLLPTTMRMTATASCGITAVAMSLLVIKALPYEVLWDWGIEAPPKQNLLAAVAEQAQKVGVDDNEGLEEAMGDLASKAGVDELAPEAMAMAAAADARKRRVDCLIVGYNMRDRRIESFVLAREHLGKLVHVGTVSVDPGDLPDDFPAQLARVPRERPFVSIPAVIDAKWVQPRFTCRVKCDREAKSGKLIGMEFDKLLGKISF